MSVRGSGDDPSIRSTLFSSISSSMETVGKEFQKLKAAVQQDAFVANISKKNVEGEQKETGGKVHQGLARLAVIFTANVLHPVIGASLTLASLGGILVKHMKPGDASTTKETLLPKNAEDISKAFEEVCKPRTTKGKPEPDAVTKQRTEKFINDLVDGLSETEFLGVMKELLEKEYEQTASQPPTFLRLNNVTSKLVTAYINKELNNEAFTSSMATALEASKPAEKFDDKMAALRGATTQSLPEEEKKAFKGQIDSLTTNLATATENMSPKLRNFLSTWNEVSASKGQGNREDAFKSFYLRAITPKLTEARGTHGMELPKAIQTAVNGATIKSIGDDDGTFSKEQSTKLLNSFHKAISSTD